MLITVLTHCYEALLPGGRLAVLIGDARRKGQYTAIIKDVLNFPHGEVRSVIIKVQRNCASDRRGYGKLEDPPIKHEYCVIFKKGADGPARFSAAKATPSSSGLSEIRAAVEAIGER